LFAESGVIANERIGLSILFSFAGDGGDGFLQSALLCSGFELALLFQSALKCSVFALLFQSALTCSAISEGSEVL